MWAEARKHEKKLRGLMIDFRRRAERRREFYDRIRSDPAAFLQIHGSQLKIHIDANLSSAADSSLMPWMGDNTNMIDRFDVRAHLDRLDIVANTSSDDIPSTSEEEALERQMNYERYRNLVQNDFLGLNETKFLNQIYHEERFGAPKEYPQNKSNQKKRSAENKAAIGLDYEEFDYSSQTVQNKNGESDSEESSDDDYDFDTTVNIDQLDNEAGHRINSIALKFGMKNDDFVKYLDEDKTEAEKLRVQKEIDNEKSMFTGRKSRRERRALKEQRLLILRAGNVEESKVALKKPETEKHQSSSDSEMSVDETKIEFITSFGGSSEDEAPKESMEKKQKQELIKRKQKIKALVSQKTEPIPVVYGPTLPGEDSVCPITSTSFNKSSHSKQRTYRFNDSKQRSRSKSRSRSRNRSRLRTNSRHYSRKSRSKSRSPDTRHSLNRTPDRYRDRRRRSLSRDRHRRRSRTRSSSRSRNRRNRRSRSRSRDRRGVRRGSRSRRISRSSSRSRIHSRRRSRSRGNSRSRRRSRSRSKRRSRSRDRDRKRDNERGRDKSSPNRSRSKSQNKVNRSEENNCVLQVDSHIEDTNKSNFIVHSVPTEVDLRHREQTSGDTVDERKYDIIDSQNNEVKELIKEDKPLKVPSPPIKSYYRHDLCDSEVDSEDDLHKEIQKTENEEEKGNSSKPLNNVSKIRTSDKSSKNTLQEKHKKKIQALIDKQFKLDKKAEMEKLEKQQQEREDREEELREITSKIRYRRGNREPLSSRSSSRSESRSSSTSGSSSSSSSY